MNRTHEVAFETVLESHLLQTGYLRIAHDGFDRERAIFPEIMLGFIRETQPREWSKSGGAARRSYGRTDPRRPLQVDGRQRRHWQLYGTGSNVMEGPCTRRSSRLRMDSIQSSRLDTLRTVWG